MPMVNPSPSYPRLVFSALAALTMATAAGFAQPADYIDLGDRTGGGVLVIPVRLAHPAAVQWYRIELPATGPVGEPGGFADISILPTFEGEFLRAGLYAVFDSAGIRVAVGRRVSDRVVFQTSFGSHDPRPPMPVPPVDEPEAPNPAFAGQEGTLPAGVYWCAVANHATFGLTDWSAAGQAESNDVATVLYFHIQPPNIPYCDGDFNWDGNVDQDDVLYLANVLAGGENPTGRWADYNRDGNEDQDDLLALVHTIAGGGCP